LGFNPKKDLSPINEDKCLSIDKFILKELQFVNLVFTDRVRSFYEFLSDMLPYLMALETLKIDNIFADKKYN